jgi:putative redox protein
MDARVVWKSGLSFSGTAGADGGPVALGPHSAAAVSGASKPLEPLELLLIGLGGCTGMDVISILEKKRQEVSGFEVRVHGDRAEEHPKVFTRITLEYRVTGRGVDRAAVERAVELSETKYCPAMAMLRKAAPIETRISISEE